MLGKELYEKLARLAVRKGVNVQKGQPLVINASIKDLDFVKMCVKEAYEAGAKTVNVDWFDEDLIKMKYNYQSVETLCDIAQWRYDKEKHEHDEGACYLTIESVDPAFLKEVDGNKINAYQQASYTKFKDLMSYTMNNEGQWCIIGLPSIHWAKTVFPELDEKQAFEKLEKAIFEVSRVSEDSDPIENWDKHDEELINHANKLNEYNFKELHFTSELGTDLTVGLVKDHIWVGGGAYTPKGIFFDPNIPTEEVFSMPEKTKVNGIVYASKPLSYNGKIIENFWFRFKDGKVIEYGAKKEEEALKNLLEFDEGASYLGEVALVPYDSPISKSNILFFNTLYDENAACHLALGAPYPENIKDGYKMSEEELKASGANNSMQHEDFMFGTKEMDIDGITYDGQVIPVFRKGNFVF